MIALLPLAFAPDGLWLTASIVPSFSPSEATGRPYVVVPASTADEPVLSKIRKQGRKVYLFFDATRPGPERSTLPIDWFAQPIRNFGTPSRGWDVLSLDSEAAFEYQRSRADKFAKSAEFDGLVVGVDLRADGRTFRYGVSDRRDAIQATGLDPIDFDDPVLESGQPLLPGPEPLLRHWLRSGPTRARALVAPLIKAFADRRLPVYLRIDPELLRSGPARRASAYGNWMTLLDLPGLSGLWLSASQSALRADVDDAVRKLRTSSLPLSFIGRQVEIERVKSGIPRSIETVEIRG